MERSVSGNRWRLCCGLALCHCRGTIMLSYALCSAINFSNRVPPLPSSRNLTTHRLCSRRQTKKKNSLSYKKSKNFFKKASVKVLKYWQHRDLEIKCRMYEWPHKQKRKMIFGSRGPICSGFRLLERGIKPTWLQHARGFQTRVEAPRLSRIKSTPLCARWHLTCQHFI